jgi:hypothetical protein
MMLYAEKLNKIDERTAKKAFEGYIGSRLVILLGMWEKGEAIVEHYRGVKCSSYRQMEIELPV